MTMKFTMTREALLKPLMLIAGAVEKRHTLPILSHILMTLDGQTCVLTGTDSEIELTGRFTLEHAADVGCLTVPARKLADICRALPDGADMEFSHENQRLTLRSGRARFNLATLSAVEFPKVETGTSEHEVLINTAEFLALFKQTHFAMATQDVRFFLNGALLEVDEEGMKVVATDGHRLAMSQSLLAPANISVPTHSIIPRKAVTEILRLFQDENETLRLNFSPHFLKITSSDYTLVTKLIDGRYPPYRKVFPRPSENYLIVDKAHFQQALTCISIVTSEKYRGIRVQVRPQHLKLIARNPEQEEAEQDIAIEEQTAAELDIGFNVSYLMDALNAIGSDHVKMIFSDADNGVILEDTLGAGGRYVVMPLRL